MLASIRAVRGLAATSTEFKVRLYGVALERGADPDNLATIISFESGGTFSPSIKNAAGSGATGLIQFMPSTAQSLGTSTRALSQMTAEAQLEYVLKYFSWFGKGSLVTLEDTYMAVLWPAGIGKPNEYVLWNKNSQQAAYRQNSGFDFNADGNVTKAEVSRAIRALYNAAVGRLSFEVPDSNPVARPTLELGSKGPDVKILQGVLGVVADGSFGPKTAAALVAWQVAHGIEGDAVCGPITWAAIFPGQTLDPQPEPPLAS